MTNAIDDAAVGGTPVLDMDQVAQLIRLLEVKHLKVPGLGRALGSLLDVLHRAGLISKRAAAGPQADTSPLLWKVALRSTTPRLRGKQAASEVEKMHEFLDGAELACERIGPGRYRIADRVLYCPASGAIRVEGVPRHYASGLAALAHVLARETGAPSLEHLLPQPDPDALAR